MLGSVQSQLRVSVGARAVGRIAGGPHPAAGAGYTLQRAPTHATTATSSTEAGTSGMEGEAAAAPAKKPVKRNMALHIGYVGTEYTGLQANRQLPELATVEGVLEKAILDADLITAANYGDFRKTKWSRSSRTDKGVHSLATVIGLRVLVDEATYDDDPEGLIYARAINQHLPANVRVFAVQRTNKSFSARRWCCNRTYEYYLPAALLGLETPAGSSEGDAAKLALLREVLAAYVGYRAFHNFAGQRGQYVAQRAKAARRREKREARAAAEAAGEGSSDSEAAEAQPAAAAPSSAAVEASVEAQATASATADADDADAAAEAEAAVEAQQYAAAAAAGWQYSGEGPVAPELQWRQQVYFLSAEDPDDPVVKSHYRMMRSFTADDPRPLVPGGVPCLRLEVCGDSFMLHQIRNMVGTAVAIVRGIMPRELLEVALSAPGRVTLPRAPPHSLLLSASAFSPFPAGWGLDTPLVAKYTGDRLRLREGGQQELLAFRREVFDAAINELLLHPDWDTWSRLLLPRYSYDPEASAAAVAAHAAWLSALQARRAAQEAAKAQRLAAEAEAAAKAEAQAAAQAAAEQPPAAAAPPSRSCVLM